MMSQVSLPTAAGRIALRLAKGRGLADRWTMELFFTLSEAYARITGRDLSEEDAEPAARTLYQWYSAAYQGAGLACGDQGSKKNVNQFTREEAYQFDTLYTWSVFEGCLLRGKRPECECLLHLAVAFKLDPEACDGLLRAYGYLPLHVKNLHHLAIYTVLSGYTDSQRVRDGDYGQFGRLRALYQQARQVVELGGGGEEDMPEEEARAFLRDDTELIRAHLFAQGNLTGANFIHLVARHTDTFTYLHTAIRREYFSLLDAFQPLYDIWGKGGLWCEGEEWRFCLFEFLNRFCTTLARKRYNENLRTIIQKKGRHPTRELMVVLWIYAYCFLESPPVYVMPDYRRKLRSRALQDCMDGEQLDLRRYLGGAVQPPARRWDLAELLLFLNGKLQKFGWPPLSRSQPFDAAVMELGRFTVEDGSQLALRWQTEGGSVLLSDTVPRTDNVPQPLTAVFALLSALQDQTPVPVLNCGLYEML